MPNKSPNQIQQALQVELESAASAHMLTAPNGWGRLIQSALRPYRIELSAAGASVRARGDALAVRIAGLILDRARETRVRDAQQAHAIVDDAVAYVLRHDLPFRLQGLARAVQPRSLSQVAFMDIMLQGTRDLAIGIGPTGCGKTHLAIAAGLSAVATGRASKLVATRPHIMDTGEVITASIRAETANDFQLRPLEDELLGLLGHAEVQRRKELEQIEILPLGHLRGRTLNNAFVVIDEAQNLTIRKMRMAVTRLGADARMVIVGDPQQVDLHEEEPSGLPHLVQMLAGTDIAEVFEFEGEHIVRNDTAAQIEALYSSHSGSRARVA